VLKPWSPDRAGRCYGIEVAKLAGLPPEVAVRAREVLHEHVQLSFLLSIGLVAYPQGTRPNPPDKHHNQREASQQRYEQSRHQQCAIHDCSDRIKERGSLRSHEKQEGVKWSWIFFRPQQKIPHEGVPESSNLCERGSTNPEQRSSDNVCRIVDAQVDSRQADDERGVEQRQQARAPRDEKNCRGQPEEQYRMITGE
jgi:hypothetical protein